MPVMQHATPKGKKYKETPRTSKNRSIHTISQYKHTHKKTNKSGKHFPRSRNDGCFGGMTFDARRRMHKTATGTIVAGTDLLVNIVEEEEEASGDKVPRGRFCRVGFCIWDDGERHAILPENERIDICSWTGE